MKKCKHLFDINILKERRKMKKVEILKLKSQYRRTNLFYKSVQETMHSENIIDYVVLIL